VGTSSPATALEVVGGATGSATNLLQLRSNFTGVGTETGLRFTNSTGSTSDTASAEISYERTNSPASGAGDLHFRVANGSSLFDAVTIDSSGRLGIGTTNPNNANNSLGSIGFRINSSERVRIDSSGRLLVGTSSSIDVASTAPAAMQVAHAAGLISGAFYSTANASGPGGVIALGHGRNSTSGLLSSGDVMGQIRFAGADGTDMETAGAQISAEVDGTPGANDMPGRLVFSTTADGASSPTERMRIDSSGKLLVGTTSNSGGADIQAANSLSVGGLIKREFSKELGLSDNVETTYLTFSIPGATVYNRSVNVGAEISYVISANRITSLRRSSSTYGKVYVAIDRHWESNTDNPVAVNLVDTDKALCSSTNTPTITWAASVEAGIDNAAKEVYIKVTVNNPSTGTILTSITGTVTYHTRTTASDAVTVS